MGGSTTGAELRGGGDGSRSLARGTAPSHADSANNRTAGSANARLIVMSHLWKRPRMSSSHEPTPAHKPAAKLRLDQVLVERGLVESRARAQSLILAGLVYLGEVKMTKAGAAVAVDAAISVRGRDHPWVSRGGIKLAHALAHFGLDPAGAVAMDIGSSTGGFTDVLLTHGAVHVFAVDSGTNQLAWKLRNDPRVTVLEQTSARILTERHIDRPATWVVCDASFIGLRKVLEVPLALATRPTRLVALIKPQFEVGRGEVGKGGVVRDPALHKRVCDDARNWLTDEGWHVDGIVESPITGPEGNVEFLIAAVRE